MIFDLILEHARRTPLAAALDASGTRWTYAAFASAMVGLTEQLARQDLPAQGVAVLRLGRRVDAWLAGLALRRLGLDTIGLGSSAPVASLQLGGVCCIVVDQDCDAAELAKLAPPQACRVLRIAGSEPDQWAQPMPPGNAPPQRPPGAHILVTSGTTGQGKKVRQHPVLGAARLAETATRYGMDRSSSVYVADFPLSTGGGYRWPLMAWSVGGHVVIDQRADIGAAYRAGALTHAFATPLMLRGLLSLPPQALRRSDTLRLLVAGGAVSRAQADAARARLTPHLLSALGATEASTFALTPMPDGEGPPWHHILPGCELEVVDALDRPLPAGEVGALRVRPMDGINAYLDSPEATVAHFRDGWFYTGDMAILDGTGRLALRGRANDVINCQGNKIAPEPLELALQERLGVEAVCIFATPGTDQQDQLHVAIQSRRPIKKRELFALATTELVLFGSVRFHIVDTLARNDMGKFQRAQIRQMLRDR